MVVRVRFLPSRNSLYVFCSSLQMYVYLFGSFQSLVHRGESR
jgi:hypothetical protein